MRKLISGVSKSSSDSTDPEDTQIGSAWVVRGRRANVRRQRAAQIRIFTAIVDLYNAGENITQRAVLVRAGKGSFTTITKCLKIWRRIDLIRWLKMEFWVRSDGRFSFRQTNNPWAWKVAPATGMPKMLCDCGLVPGWTCAARSHNCPYRSSLTGGDL